VLDCVLQLCTIICTYSWTTDCSLRFSEFVYFLLVVVSTVVNTCVTNCLVSLITRMTYNQGTRSLASKNSGTFPGLSRNAKTFSQDLVIAEQCLNIQTNSSYLLYIYMMWQYNPSWNVHHKLQRNCSASNVAGILRTLIYTWCSIHKRHDG